MPESFDDEESGFMQSLKGVRKLESDKFDLNQQKRNAKIRIQPHSEAFHSFNTHDVSDQIASSIPEQWFSHGMQKKLRRKFRIGALPVEATLDLHGLRQQQAIDALKSFLNQALNAQLRCLLIIHGKGFRSESQAKLRPLVQHWLQQQAMVLAFCPAQPRDGGSGASYVYIKNR